MSAGVNSPGCLRRSSRKLTSLRVSPRPWNQTSSRYLAPVGRIARRHAPGRTAGPSRRSSRHSPGPPGPSASSRWLAGRARSSIRRFASLEQLARLGDLRSAEELLIRQRVVRRPCGRPGCRRSSSLALGRSVAGSQSLSIAPSGRRARLPVPRRTSGETSIPSLGIRRTESRLVVRGAVGADAERRSRARRARGTRGVGGSWRGPFRQTSSPTARIRARALLCWTTPGRIR